MIDDINITLVMPLSFTLVFSIKAALLSHANHFQNYKSTPGLQSQFTDIIISQHYYHMQIIFKSIAQTLVYRASLQTILLASIIIPCKSFSKLLLKPWFTGLVYRLVIAPLMMCLWIIQLGNLFVITIEMLLLANDNKNLKE